MMGPPATLAMRARDAAEAECAERGARRTANVAVDRKIGRPV